ncbi:MAG: hypothetical protein OXF44_08240, partial [Anaerolineaceae bacterium]|nr:hypothetical protein [Anaerolineaceae bacterium]
MGEAGQVQRLRDFDEDVAAVVMMVATIVMMAMVAVLVRLRYRCWSASDSKVAWRKSGQVARRSTAGAVTAFVVAEAVAALFHRAG